MEEKDINAKFTEIYEQKIKPQLSKLENYRLEEKKKYDICNKVFIISWISGCVILIFSIIFGKMISAVLFFIPFISVIISSNFSSKISANYRKKIKPLLFKPILNIFGKFYLVDKESITLRDIKSLGLYHSATKKCDDDNIVGTYKDIPISLVETQLSHASKGTTKSSSSKVSVFSGLILKVKMNKRFEGITIGDQKCNINNFINLLKEMSKKYPELYPAEQLKWLDSPIFKTIDNITNFMSENKLVIKDGKLYIDIFDTLTKNNVTRKLERITLEDVDFNHCYNIYSDSQVESRYLLTPSFMQRIKEIQSFFLVLSVDFVFKDDCLYLFLNGSSQVADMVTSNNQTIQYRSAGMGFFEVGDINTTLFDNKIYLKVFRELVSIFSLVHYFKINEKTGL